MAKKKPAKKKRKVKKASAAKKSTTMNPLQIRPSQFITTYGVGAIVDGREGPAMILEYGKSEIIPETRPVLDDDNEYFAYVVALRGASRLSKLLATEYTPYKNIGLFRLITNADLSIKDSLPIYRVFAFPTTSICNRHGNTQIIYRRSYPYPQQIDGWNRVCPKCLDLHLKDKSHELEPYQSDKQVMRFIQICRNGHISDVDWNFEVHREKWIKTKKKPCKFTHLEWIEEGSELIYVKIRCPHCNETITMQELKNRSIKCRRQMPWKGKEPATVDKVREIYTDHRRCAEYVQIIQKHASNVFSPKAVSSISLPKEANAFYRTLHYQTILYGIDISQIFDFNSLYDYYEKHQVDTIIRDNPGFDECFETLKKIKEMGQSEINKAEEIIKYFIDSIRKGVPNFEEMDLRREEFQAFKEGKEQSGLLIDPTLVMEDPIEITLNWMDKKDITFLVTPIPKLEVILVQKGFTRIAKPPKIIKEKRKKYVQPRLVRTPYVDSKDNLWYMSLKLNGEGIFVCLKDPDALKFLDDTSKSWSEIDELVKYYEDDYMENEDKGQNEEEEEFEYEESEEEEEGDEGDDEEEEEYDEIDLVNPIYHRGFEAFANPLGVWWHTFSHRLIIALSLDCGYSSASLRERLYINENEGGVLIYATQSGEDGTLGGLVSQAIKARFREILNNSLARLDSCSNDPICLESDAKQNIENGFAPNGAACYACLFLSETSCEFGNIGLDRNVLIKNPN